MQDLEVEMEEPEKSSPEAAHLDPGLDKTEEQLRRAVRGNSHTVLLEAVETPISELDIPLCRMIPMTDVRHPLKTDIQKLKSEFTGGYKRASACFYVSLSSFRMEEAIVTDEVRKGWSRLWRKEDEEFEGRLRGHPSLHKFSNHMFYVWDGNHRHIAWYDIINNIHKDDPEFHAPVKAVVLKVTPQNCNLVLHAMTDWNK